MNPPSSLRNKLSYYLFVLLIIICALQFSAWGIRETIYPVLRNIIIVFIFFIFLTSYKNISQSLRKVRLLKTHLIGLLVFVFVLLLYYPFSVKIEINPVRDLIVSLVLMVVGLNMNLTKKQFITLIDIYIVAFTVASVSIVYSFASGYVIQELYLPVPKNQIAPAFGTAFILSFYFGFKRKRVAKILYYLLGAILLASLLVIRGRAVIVGVFLSIIVFIFYFIRGLKYKILTIIGAILLIPFIGQFVYESLFLSYDVSSINSLSTGRFDTYLLALSFLKEHLIFGLMATPSFGDEIIHNYLLYNIVNYGILISSILVIIYFRYVIVLYKAIRNNKFQYFEVGPLVMVIIFVVSLFEYTYPYAPGSAIFFHFFLIGQYFRKKNSVNFQHKISAVTH